MVPLLNLESRSSEFGYRNGLAATPCGSLNERKDNLQDIETKAHHLRGKIMYPPFSESGFCQIASYRPLIISFSNPSSPG